MHHWTAQTQWWPLLPVVLRRWAGAEVLLVFDRTPYRGDLMVLWILLALGGNHDHNVIGGGFASRAQADGTFSQAFPAPGQYDYLYTLHGGMDGAVVVTYASHRRAGGSAELIPGSPLTSLVRSSAGSTALA